MLVLRPNFESEAAMRLLLLGALAVALCGQHAHSQPASWTDPSPHEVLTVTVEPGVQLEVLDWGGSGEPMVFLAGLGNTAHAYDDFAPRFRDSFRVYGVTRRGFGASSRPEDGYDVATRARDIVAVLDSLRIGRAILVGHSIAGDELSRLADDYPRRVLVLVYLDAFSYGEDYAPMAEAPWPPQAFTPMTAADSASVESVAAFVAGQYGVALPEAEIRATSSFSPDGRLASRGSPGMAERVIAGSLRSEYARIDAPAIAFYATDPKVARVFPNIESFDDENRSMAESFVRAMHDWRHEQIERFRTEMRRGAVVEIPGGHHYIHYSHADAVEFAMRSFVGPYVARPCNCR
jgi:non-heme chloroperoxidase